MKQRYAKRLAAAIAALVLVLTARPTAPVEVTAEVAWPGLSSLSAIVYEPQSGTVLFEKDAHTARPMASTTKLMTALVMAEVCAPEQEVTVTAEMVAVEGSALGLRAGDSISVDDLLTGMLLESGNDAANAAALTVSGSLPEFAERMNQKAADLGMRESHFVTPSGLDAEGHAASAYDMALLAAAVLENEQLAAICATKSDIVRFGNPKRDVAVFNHNKLLSKYPDAIGMKTGYTTKSGRCLVSAARRDGVTLIVVTLNGHDYWNDHMSLYECGFSQIESVTPELPALSPLPVSGGASATVALTAQPPQAVSLLKGTESQLTAVVDLPDFVWAPLEAGEVLGEIRWYLDGRLMTGTAVTAAETVAEKPPAGFARQWWRWIRDLMYALTVTA